MPLKDIDGKLELTGVDRLGPALALRTRIEALAKEGGKHEAEATEATVQRESARFGLWSGSLDSAERRPVQSIRLRCSLRSSGESTLC